jgi:hypothetical protein
MIVSQVQRLSADNPEQLIELGNFDHMAAVARKTRLDSGLRRKDSKTR